jgi:hypothetical protein
MKKIFLTLVIAISSFTGAYAQAAAGDVTLEMADGTTKRGYARTEMKNEVKFFELSAEQKGERTRYDNDQIARIVFDNGETYVKYDVIVTAKGQKTKNAWVLVVHRGNGIAVYSAFVEGWEQVNNHRRKVAQTNFYISLGGDPAIWASTVWHTGGVLNRGGFNRAMLNYYFSKRYPQYADLAKRVKAKEFEVDDSPMEVIRAWEEAYGGK